MEEPMNHVANICFNGKYIDKMPMYSRPGKSIWTVRIKGQ